MVSGMTGFGSSEKGGFRVEVRSLNHKFLDISIKMPPEISRHEIALRELVKERFKRGRFDILILPEEERRVAFKLNNVLAKEIFLELETLRKELGLEREIDMGVLLNWKELFIKETLKYDLNSLFDAFNEAVEEVEKMRLKEGEMLSSLIISSLQKIEALNDEVISLSYSLLKRAKERFTERLSMFIPEELGVDDIKLILEASRIAEKADITEETARIKGYLSYMRKILEDGGKIGKRLDFIIQEIQREINTITSKVEEEEIVKIALNIKAEIETIREQVQNIE